MTEATSIATIFEDFGLDHAPDGWPPIKQMHLTAAAAELRRLEAQLQKETAARQAAQIEAEALKERLVRADAEKCAAVLAERIAPNAPVQEPVHKLIYPGGGKALFNRLWHLTCNAVATQSGMRVRTDVMPMREMKEFLDHLCVLVDSPPQPVPAPVQEQPPTPASKPVLLQCLGCERVGTQEQLSASTDCDCWLHTQPAPVREPVDGDIRSDAMADLSYLNGLKAGWNFCVANDDTGYAAAVYARSDALHALKTAPVQEPDTSCKFPMCQTEQYQQMLAAQVARDLFAIEQPSKAVKLSYQETMELVPIHLQHFTDGVLLQFIGAIEAAVLKANGWTE